MVHRTLRAPALGLALVVSLSSLAACGSSDDGSGRTPAADASASASTSSADRTDARFFADSSPWNTRVDTLPTDPQSGRMIGLAAQRVGVVETGGVLRTQEISVDDPLYINTEAWTTPVVSGGVPTSVVCRQIVCGDGDDEITLDIPDDVDPDPRYDGWFTVFDAAHHVAYDLWRARREDDGSISYHYMKKWDLDGPGFGAPQEVSARGSGLPLFAGLIRPDELENGLIDHALAISLPGPAAGSFVSPASSTDGNGDASSIPEGARIRLKADAIIAPARDPRTGELIKMTAQQRRMADAIVAALRTYGAIVVDRATVPTLYAQRDVTSGLINGNELQGLHLWDFEVVDLGERFEYPAHDDAATDASTSSADTTTATGRSSQ